MLKLKIGLLLDSSLDLEDGVQQYVMSVGEWLRAQGHDVHYLVGQTKSRKLPNIHSLSRNIVVRFNGNRINLPLWGNSRRIRQLFHEHRFDVLYVQAPYHPLMAQRVILAAPKQTVIVGSYNILPHSWFVAHANRALRLLLLPSLRRFDQMLAVSSAAAQYEQWTFGLPADISPNVFDFERFHTAKPFERYDDDTPTILFLGRLVPRKGCQVLLESIAAMKQSGQTKFRVLICGKGPLDEQLRQYCLRSGIAEHVEFTGFVTDEDKPRYYASADIAVFPSSGGESFGIVLLEAMASGKAAVLAGDNPGYRTVMAPQPDLLFAPTDANQLAAKLSDVLRNTQRRQTYAAWGADYARQFDVNLVGRQLLTLYENLYDQKNVR